MILISDLQNIQNHELTLFALNNSWVATISYVGAAAPIYHSFETL